MALVSDITVPAAPAAAFPALRPTYDSDSEPARRRIISAKTTLYTLNESR